MYARGVTSVAEQTDQTLGFVLRILENQQADGFLFDGHRVSQYRAERARKGDKW